MLARELDALDRELHRPMAVLKKSDAFEGVAASLSGAFPRTGAWSSHHCVWLRVVEQRGKRDRGGTFLARCGLHPALVLSAALGGANATEATLRPRPARRLYGSNCLVEQERRGSLRYDDGRRVGMDDFRD